MTIDESPSPHVPATRVLLWERVVDDDPSVAWLRSQGLDVVLGQPNREPHSVRYAEADLIADARGCAGLLGSGGARITRAVIESIPTLRVVSKVGTGVDNIDVAAASERGIAVCNTPDDSDAAAVAEHAFCLLLALCKPLHAWSVDSLRQGTWRSARTFATRLDGKTIGIIGFGRIGRAFAQRLAGWNVEILVHDPWLAGSANAAMAVERAAASSESTVAPMEASPPASIPIASLPAGARWVDLDTLLARSDAISLHCPARADGRPVIDAAALQRMRASAFLVNTARASLIDGAAVAAALERGALGGAAIDVFDPEPPRADDPLLRAPRVVCTPHVASWTREGYLRRRQLAAENLARRLRGEAVANVVNAESLA